MVIQSISIVNTLNQIIFLQRFEKIVFGIVIYYIGSYLLPKQEGLKKKIIIVYSISYLIKNVLEASIYLHVFQNIHLNTWFHPVFMNTLEANMNRNRPYFDLFLESSYPLFIYLILRYLKNTYKNMLTICSFFITLFLSFVSEWRGRFINELFVLFFTIKIVFLNKKINIKKLLIFIFLTFVLYSFLSLIDRNQLEINDYSIVDRFAEINISPSNNVDSTNWRINMFKNSVSMAQNYFFGVGLGNFYDSLENKYKFFSSKLLNNYKIGQEAVLSGPHNIFFQYMGESGVFGLLSLILMLSVFLVKDISVIKSNGKYKKVEIQLLILAFWSLIIGAQFYPAIDIAFYTTFFLLRALINFTEKEALISHNIKN